MQYSDHFDGFRANRVDQAVRPLNQFTERLARARFGNSPAGVGKVLDLLKAFGDTLDNLLRIHGRGDADVLRNNRALIGRALPSIGARGSRCPTNPRSDALKSLVVADGSPSTGIRQSGIERLAHMDLVSKIVPSRSVGKLLDEALSVRLDVLGIGHGRSLSEGTLPGK